MEFEDVSDNDEDEDEGDPFDDEEFELGDFQETVEGTGGSTVKRPFGKSGLDGDSTFIDDLMFTGEDGKPFDPEVGGYIRPRGPGLDGGLSDDFDMFDLDVDFDGLDDAFDQMGDPLGGYMADFGGFGDFGMGDFGGGDGLEEVVVVLVPVA
eukprot:gene2971-3256_t